MSVTAQVFISYARETRARDAEVLYETLAGDAFLDREAIAPGARFPERLADALLACRVVVALADAAYFRRWYCGWELDAALGPYALALAGGRNPDSYLDHLVVVLPEGRTPLGLDRFPPRLPATGWTSADNPSSVLWMVRKCLARSIPSLGQSYTSLGQSPDLVRDRLLERSENRTAVPPASGGLGPWTVPTSLGDRFVGRARDLWRVDRALSQPPEGAWSAAPKVVIEGAGGVGKTRLALEYLHRFGPNRFPGGAFWIDAGEDVESQHHRILQALEPAVPELPTFRREQRDAAGELAAALRKRAATARVLLIVDDIPETAPGIHPFPLSRWCPAMERVAVLATSRVKLGPGERAVSIPLEGLERAAAVQLLAAGSESTSPLEPYQAIAEWVGGLPLALTLLGAALELGSISVRELAQRAAGAGGQTETLDAQMEAIRPHVPVGSLRGVTEALSVSYQRLSPAAQRAARVLALLAPVPIPIELVQVLDIGPATRAELVARSWVHKPRPGAEMKEVELFGSMHRVLADFLRVTEPPAAEDWVPIYRCVAAAVDRALKAQRWRALLAYAPHVLHVLRRPGRMSAISDEARALLGEALAFSMAGLAHQERPRSELPEYVALLSRSQGLKAVYDACELATRIQWRSYELARSADGLVESVECLQHAFGVYRDSPVVDNKALATLMSSAQQLLESMMESVRLMSDGSEVSGTQIADLVEAGGRFRACLERLDGALQADQGLSKSQSSALLESVIDATRAFALVATRVQGVLARLGEELAWNMAATTEEAVVAAMRLEMAYEHPSGIRDERWRMQMKAGEASVHTGLMQIRMRFREIAGHLVDLGRLRDAGVINDILADIARYLDAK